MENEPLSSWSDEQLLREHAENIECIERAQVQIERMHAGESPVSETGAVLDPLGPYTDEVLNQILLEGIDRELERRAEALAAARLATAAISARPQSNDTVHVAARSHTQELR